MVFIPLQTLVYCIPFGIFDDEEEAKCAYMKYITSHENFNTWFEQLKKDFNKMFGETDLRINNETDFKNVIFKKDLYDDQAGDMEGFWEGRCINAGDIIQEVSDEYTQRKCDVFELGAQYNWGYDDTFGNHLSNLILSLECRSASVFDNQENYIERMAKIHPLF